MSSSWHLAEHETQKRSEDFNDEVWYELGNRYVDTRKKKATELCVLTHLFDWTDQVTFGEEREEEED